MVEYGILASRMEEQEETISVWNLFNIVNERVKNLKIDDECKRLIKKISIQNNSLVKFLRILGNVNTYLNFECKNIKTNIYDNKLEIHFEFYNFYNQIYEVVLVKDVRNNYVCFDSNYCKDKMLLNNYYEEIMNIFNKLEEYYGLVYNSNLQKLDNALMIEDQNLNINIVLSLNETLPLLRVSHNDYDLDRYRIIEYRDNTRLVGVPKVFLEQVLNDIYVNKLNLSLPFKQILEEREKTTVKKLVRK